MCRNNYFIVKLDQSLLLTVGIVPSSALNWGVNQNFRGQTKFLQNWPKICKIVETSLDLISS